MSVIFKTIEICEKAVGLVDHVRRRSVRNQIGMAIHRAVSANLYVKQFEQTEDDVEESLAPVFDAQIASSSAKLARVPEGEYNPEDLVKRIFDPDDWDEAVVNATLPPLALASGEAAMAQLVLMGIDPDETGKATTASEWLADQDKPPLETVTFQTPAGNVSMAAASEWPEWMKEDITRNLEESFAQDYWPKVNQTTSGDIETFLRSGLARGESIETMARKMQPRLFQNGLYARRRARTIARTECLPGDTVVSGARPVAAHRRFYDGLWIEIVTKTGRKLSGTPNHPVLTQRGWVGLGDLLKSDYLICQKRRVDGFSPSGDMNVEHPPPTIDDVFSSFSAVGIFERRRTGKPDFHGDGMDGYVDVFTSDSFLSYGRFTPIDQCAIDDVLAESDARRVMFAALCNPFPRGVVHEFHRIFSGSYNTAISADCTSNRRSSYIKNFTDRFKRFAGCVHGKHFINSIVDVFCESSVACGQHQSSGLLEGSSGNVISFQNSKNSVFSNTKMFGGCQTAMAGQIEIDQLAFINRSHFCGPVFNLTTRDGYFIANGFYTGNTGHALNGARVSAIEQVKEDLPEITIKKEWLSVLGNTTRASHALLHGRREGRDGKWPLGGVRIPWPSHTSLPPSERCNCQCTVVTGFGR